MRADRSRGGKPSEITNEMRARIVEVVQAHSEELGEPYAQFCRRCHRPRAAAC